MSSSVPTPFCTSFPCRKWKGRPALSWAHYLRAATIYAIAALQVIGGLLLLLGTRFVALGLTLLGPVIVNVVLYHIFLDRNGLPVAFVVLLLSLFLLWIYRFKFPNIFQI